MNTMALRLQPEHANMYVGASKSRWLVPFLLLCLFAIRGSSTEASSRFSHDIKQRKNLQTSPEMTRRLALRSSKVTRRQQFQCPDSLGLPLGDMNLLVVTDIHGWIAGEHSRHEPAMNADFGTLLSLYERLQECAPNQDFFLLFNGDFMDGTGLSAVPPKHLVPLLQKMPFSALNVGNHELYFNEVVDYMMEDGGFIEQWNGKYLASNVDYIVRNEKTLWTVPLGSRYTFLHGANRNSTILTFGFLYNFLNNCNHTKVQFVEETLLEDWFVNVLTKTTFDTILVLGHFDAVDPLVYTIWNAIRAKVGPDMPLYFLTGHTHRRHYERLDPLAASLEAGRFMDTIGFASFPLQQSAAAAAAITRQQQEDHDDLYQHQMLNTNVEELATTIFHMKKSETSDFSTPNGQALSQEMQRVQQELGLLDVLTHCAPQDYHLEKPTTDESSLWWLYVNQVVPKTLLPMVKKKPDMIPIFLQGTGALRYTLFSPIVVVDDIVAVSPFDNPIWKVGCSLTAHQLNHVFDVLQVDQDSGFWGLTNFGVAGERPDRAASMDDSVQRYSYELYSTEFELRKIMRAVRSALTGEADVVDDCLQANSPVYPDYPNESRHKHYGIHHKQRHGEPMDTADLWFDFIETEWKCPPNHKTEDSHSPENRWEMMVSNSQSSEPISHGIAMLAAVFLILLYALASVKKQEATSTRVGDGGDAALQLVDRTSRAAGEVTPLLEATGLDGEPTSYS